MSLLTLQPNALFTNHVGLASGRGLSGRLWAHSYGQSQSPDGAANAYSIGSDFIGFGGLLSSTTGHYSDDGSHYISYQDSGNTITQLSTEVGGVIRIETDTTDNDESWLNAGGITSVLGKILSTAPKLTIFESRFRINLTGATHNFFLGLTEEGTAAADNIGDTGVWSATDRLGFYVQEGGAGTALKFGYAKAATGWTGSFTLGTIAADTWYKVGFVLDPRAQPSKRIKVFLDNEEASNYVTADAIAASTFPDGEELNFCAGVKNGAAAATKLDLDWWAFHQAA